ncbi:FAD-dependent oxidoreductase [Amaricoccus solimangrovi]|uniref:FAD-dependent oxidoreductase n=1 Tax=Amaricoccus solimangrovi TaxID=2589815 RepID=A0A501WBH3_9RHOB|nr:FAD-dependent oxidoreductase [Amaricoccus solimangrovi]TPE45730.1 FAD-dependent oxidoreductase [Amaricoccus solimangrovi]
MESAGFEDLPVAVIGAGPVGLAAAARLVERGLRPLVLERGPGAGTAIQAWGHVRMFSPWRYDIDAAARTLLEATGSLIDPNLHSRGTVPPHGVAEPAHPEPGVYVVGAKSYGRAPTFLMATGYEQVRSVVAEIAGDRAAAREVRLVLPETGVCAAGPIATEAGCCGGPAPAEAAACCALDAEAKTAGRDGCGCGASGSAVVVGAA